MQIREYEVGEVKYYDIDGLGHEGYLHGLTKQQVIELIDALLVITIAKDMLELNSKSKKRF